MSKISRLCWISSNRDTWTLKLVSRKSHIRDFFRSPQVRELLEEMEIDRQRETEIPKHDAGELAQRIIHVAKKVSTAQEMFVYMNEHYGTERVTPVLCRAIDQYEEVRHYAHERGFVPSNLVPRDAVHPETYSESGVNISVSLQMACRFIVNHLWDEFGVKLS